MNIVKNTIKSEQWKAMHSNIRNTVKTMSYRGINRILVPRHKDTHKHLTNFQEFLATTEEHDIQWDTILDKNPSISTFYGSIETTSEQHQRSHAAKA